MPELDLMMNDGGKPIRYSNNDWFYMKTKTDEQCNDSQNKQKCENNKIAVNNLQKSTNDLGSSLTQYNDAKMLYNRELLFTVNMLFGIGMLCYYIYLNKSAIPSPSDAIKGVGDVGKTLSITVQSPPIPPIK